MRPDDFAGQWLFTITHRAGNALAELLQAKCTALGMSFAVTPSQWVALAWLDEDNGIPIGTLAHHLDIEASVTTGIVQRLEQRELLERVHDQEDRRVVKIFLTQQGRELVQALEPVVIAFHERLFQGFSAEEQRTFATRLHHLMSNVPTDAEDLRTLLLSQKPRENPS
jgi:DNA-binding MarR family transcriptional regulator